MRPTAPHPGPPNDGGNTAPPHTHRHIRSRIRTSDIVDVATQLINARSENPGDTEELAVNTLANCCRARGLDVELTPVAPGRANLTATLRASDGPGIILLGHTDVVPAGPGWSRDPFAAAERDGRLYGRGSADMKGGIAAAVIAMDALASSGLALRGPVQLACVVDEEQTGIGIREFIDGPRQEWAACIVAEPTDLDVVIGCRGDFYLTVEITGRAAHSGRPSDGCNAIEAAAKVIGAIMEDQQRLAQSHDDLLGHGTWNIGDIRGGQAPNIVAPHCIMVADRRLMPDEDAHDIARDMQRRLDALAIDGIRITVSSNSAMPGFKTDAKGPLVGAALSALHELGIPGAVNGWSAACDGGFIATKWGVPTIVLGPGSINEEAHQPDESVPIHQLRSAAEAYAMTIADLLGEDSDRAYD